MGAMRGRMAGRDGEAGTGAGHGEEQRRDRQHRIEGRRARPGGKPSMATKCVVPDRGPGADRGQEMPADALQAGGREPAEQPDRHPATGAADQRGDKHQPEVVLGEKARSMTRIALPSHGSAQFYLRL